VENLPTPRTAGEKIKKCVTAAHKNARCATAAHATLVMSESVVVNLGV